MTSSGQTREPGSVVGDRREGLAGAGVRARAKAGLARRIVIKLGSNVVLREDGRIALEVLTALVDSMATLRASGREVLLVTSGAVGFGRARLYPGARESGLSAKQVSAAVGQASLMATYHHLFAVREITPAQLLLTDAELAHPQRSQDLVETLQALMAHGVVPILNENDAVTGTATPLDGGRSDDDASALLDNDALAAKLAKFLAADLVLLLSDVGGLFTSNPSTDSNAEPVPVVEGVTPALLASAGGKGGRGRGGAAGKLAAARAASLSGAVVVIADGRLPQVIDQACAGAAVGTILVTEDDP